MKKRKKIYILLCGLFLFFCLLNINIVSYAEENEDNESMATLMEYIKVTPVFPENQINKKVSYLDLLMKPGQNEIIELKVKNISDEAIQVYIRAETAITNNEGRVVYRPDIEGVPYDSSLKYPFTELVHLSQDNILLESNEETIVNLIIEMPEEDIEGVILGGIRFSTDNEFMTHEIDLTKEYIYDYILGVRLEENSIEDIVPTLMITNAYPYYVNNKSGFQIMIQNATALPILDMAIESVIFKSNGKQSVASVKHEGWNMAPNSSVALNIPIQDEKSLKPGSYTAIVTIASEQGEWELTHDFVVDRQEAVRINNLAGTPLPFYERIPAYIWGIVVGIFLFIIIIIIIRIRKTKKRKKILVENNLTLSNGAQREKKKRNKENKSFKKKTSKGHNKHQKKMNKALKKKKRRKNKQKIVAYNIYQGTPIKDEYKQSSINLRDKGIKY